MVSRDPVLRDTDETISYPVQLTSIEVKFCIKVKLYFSCILIHKALDAKHLLINVDKSHCCCQSFSLEPTACWKFIKLVGLTVSELAYG